MKLSLVLATHNEEKNIEPCIASCKGIVDEIIIVDGSSTDKTVETARKLGAKVTVTDNPKMFHINKQKAIDLATGDWILQLDADERVSPELGKEISNIIQMTDEQIVKYQQNLPDKKLFERHQNLNKYSTVKSETPAINAFYIPRLNYFLGKYLRYGGVYPDGVIRLFKKGKARLPCKNVHELMEVDGNIGWLQEPLLHLDSPSFRRYLERNNRYIDQLADELRIKNQKQKTASGPIWQGFDWLCIKPIFWFVLTTFRHKGILDGWQGIVFSFFSALRFPRAYIKYRLAQS